MTPVNARMEAPAPPAWAWWILEVSDDSSCAWFCQGCGSSYAEFRSGLAWADGVACVRRNNGGWENGGGFRSRGPVLWALRVLKLGLFFAHHSGCDGGDF